MSTSSFGEALTRLWPQGDAKIPGLRAGIIAAAPVVFAKYAIGTPLLAAHVMAQISHECGAGDEVVEDLNYSAVRMMQVWPVRFPTMGSAAPFAHNPRALADKVYNGRMGNRIGTDDGWNFRGRGGAQTTGADEYRRLSKFLSIDFAKHPEVLSNPSHYLGDDPESLARYNALDKVAGLDLINHPELLIDPQHFLECAVANFIICGCLPFAQHDDVLNVTKRLNGGTEGLSMRKQWLAKWKPALGVA